MIIKIVVDIIISVPCKYKQKCIKQVQQPQLQLYTLFILFELSIILFISTMNNTQNWQNDITQLIRYGLFVINFYNPTIKKQLNPARMEQQILDANINQTIFNIANVQYQFHDSYQCIYCKVKMLFVFIQHDLEIKLSFKNIIETTLILKYIRQQNYQLIFVSLGFLKNFINISKINDHYQQLQQNLMIMQRLRVYFYLSLSESKLSMNIKRWNLTIETESIQTSSNIFFNYELLQVMQSQNKLINRKIEENISKIIKKNFKIQLKNSQQRRKFRRVINKQYLFKINQTQNYKLVELKDQIYLDFEFMRKKVGLIGVEIDDIQNEVKNFAIDIELKIQLYIRSQISSNVQYKQIKFWKYLKNFLKNYCLKLEYDVIDNHTVMLCFKFKKKILIKNLLIQLEQISVPIQNLNNLIEKHDNKLNDYKEIIQISEIDILKMIKKRNSKDLHK
ncbi:unnamed protein product [Paramecium sonneborni]|uniref:Uncharacterized protein n=1 Tax=Paramecium sonneborni TaxID=65129 RepID=A0A8S1QCC8_9CILI|nr:unnamed protein product [Paramecium sonneborni]